MANPTEAVQVHAWSGVVCCLPDAWEEGTHGDPPMINGGINVITIDGTTRSMCDLLH